MSAPLVVNTTGGWCWKRREATRDGQALYALADAPADTPEYVMATYDELEHLGIEGSAFVVPAPVGPEPEAEGLSPKRLRLAWESAKRDRRALRCGLSESESSRGRWRSVAIEAEQKLGALRARVAELEAERTVRQNEVSAAVGYTPGLKWPDLVRLVSSNTASLVQAERDVRALLDRVNELEARLAEYERPADEDPIAYALADKAPDDVTPQVQKLRAPLAGQRKQQAGGDQS